MSVEHLRTGLRDHGIRDLQITKVKTRIYFLVDFFLLGTAITTKYRIKSKSTFTLSLQMTQTLTRLSTAGLESSFGIHLSSYKARSLVASPRSNTSKGLTQKNREPLCLNSCG